MGDDGAKNLRWMHTHSEYSQVRRVERMRFEPTALRDSARRFMCHDFART